MLDASDHVFKHLVALVVALEHVDICVEFLVLFLSVSELCSQISHLIELLFVDLNDGFTALEPTNLLLVIFNLTLEPLNSVLILPLDQMDLVLQFLNPLLLFLEIIYVLVLICQEFAVQQQPLLLHLILDASLEGFRTTTDIFELGFISLVFLCETNNFLVKDDVFVPQAPGLIFDHNELLL